MNNIASPVMDVPHTETETDAEKLAKAQTEYAEAEKAVDIAAADIGMVPGAEIALEAAEARLAKTRKQRDRLLAAQRGQERKREQQRVAQQEAEARAADAATILAGERALPLVQQVATDIAKYVADYTRGQKEWNEYVHRVMGNPRAGTDRHAPSLDSLIAREISRHVEPHADLAVWKQRFPPGGNPDFAGAINFHTLRPMAELVENFVTAVRRNLKRGK